jgi:hypothetical protein
MKEHPLRLDQLEIIGYADVLPGGKGPALPPPVFCDRQDHHHCFLPPFRIADEWLLSPRCVPLAEVQDLADDRRITLFKDAPRLARPGYQLWVGVDGGLHYEPSSEAKQNLRRIYKEHLDAATAALRRGRIDEAEEKAGIALAADDDTRLEPDALMAACHVLRLEEKEVLSSKASAEDDGHSPELFALLVERYLEMVPPEIWEPLPIEKVLQLGEKAGVEVWVPFRFTEEEYRKFELLLHRCRRHGGEHEFLVSCTGTEAELMANRKLLQLAYHDAEQWVKKPEKDRVLEIAAQSLFCGPQEFSQRSADSAEKVRRIGKLAREQINDKRNAVPLVESQR